MIEYTVAFAILWILIGLYFGWKRCKEVYCIPNAVWIALLMYAIGWPYFVITKNDGLDKR